jgi:zinc transporter, ZIP family
LGEATFWAFLASASLFVGAGVALAAHPSQRVTGLVMAFGAGALISAVAYDLVLEALEFSEAFELAMWMAVGGVVFLAGDILVSNTGGRGRKRSTGEQAEGSPLAIVLGAALDGIPESLVIGLSLLLDGTVSASFLVATFLSNLPEAMAATVGLRRAGWRSRRIWGLWAIVVAISTVSAAIGYAVFDRLSGANGAATQAFAAGAVITMLADTMMPEAFEKGGRAAGLLTTLGFATAVLITSLE